MVVGMRPPSEVTRSRWGWVPSYSSKSSLSWSHFLLYKPPTQRLHSPSGIVPTHQRQGTKRPAKIHMYWFWSLIVRVRKASFPAFLFLLLLLLLLLVVVVQATPPRRPEMLPLIRMVCARLPKLKNSCPRKELSWLAPQSWFTSSPSDSDQQKTSSFRSLNKNASGFPFRVNSLRNRLLRWIG